MSEQIEPIGNATELKKVVREIIGMIGKHEEERAAINDDIRGAVERAEQLGIGRDALRMAMRYAAFDETKRAGFDAAYQIVREAIGLPIQGYLFTVEELRQQAPEQEHEDHA